MQDFITKQVKQSYKVQKTIYQDKALINLIQKVSKITTMAYRQGNKTIIAGNGGSASDAQHIAGEFVGKFYFDRPSLASISLATNTSIMTAIGNDYGYEKLFSRQIQAYGAKGDIFLGISTSGNSQNIIEALIECKKIGIITIGLTGEHGGDMKELCDYCICVPSNDTPRVQESHILIGHIICSIVEEDIFGKGFKD